MENFLPKNRITLVVIFGLVFIFGLVYLFFVKMPATTSLNKNTIAPTKNVSSPYFIPPTSKLKEVTVTGRVVKLDETTAKEKKATHKIIGNGGVVLCLAATGDDKLKQQEGNSVTLVGDISFDQTLNENTVLNVKYISFK